MKHSRKVFALIMTVAMVFTMSFSTIGVSAATKTSGKVGAVKWNKSKKEVSFQVTVNPNMLDGKAGVHFIINDKNGKKTTGNSGAGLFSSKAKALDLYNALVKAGATPWVGKGKPVPTLADAAKLADMATANLGNPAFSRLEMTFKAKDGTVYKPEDLVCYKYNGKGTAAAEPIQMCFTGNFKNQKAWNSGCVACLFSCFAGVTSNMSIGYNTVGEGADNYFYASDLLKAGDTYTVTYKIPYNYISAANLNKSLSKYKVVDVRNDADHAKGHISGALNGCFTKPDAADEQGVANLKGIVKKYGKNKKYVLCCYSGNKYAKAATQVLRSLGVKDKNIFTLAGGFNEWKTQFKYAWGQDGNIVVDPAKKTVKLDSTINDVIKGVSEVEDGTFYIIGNKDGAKGDKFLFQTAAKPLDVYNAIVALGAKGPEDLGKVTATWKMNGKNDTRPMANCLWRLTGQFVPYDDTNLNFGIFTEKPDEATKMNASGCIVGTYKDEIVTPNRCAMSKAGSKALITFNVK